MEVRRSGDAEGLHGNAKTQKVNQEEGADVEENHCWQGGPGLHGGSSKPMVLGSCGLDNQRGMNKRQPSQAPLPNQQY